MEHFDLIQKKKTKTRYHSKEPKKFDAYDIKLLNKREKQSKSRVRIENKEKKIKQFLPPNSIMKTFDSGIDHLEFLKEKNTLARKRLLDLQKRLVEVKSKYPIQYTLNEFKLPQALDPPTVPDTLSLIHKYL